MPGGAGYSDDEQMNQLDHFDSILNIQTIEEGQFDDPEPELEKDSNDRIDNLGIDDELESEFEVNENENEL